MNSAIRAFQTTVTSMLQEEISLLQQGGAPRAQVEDVTSLLFLSQSMSALMASYAAGEGHYHVDGGSLLDKEPAVFALGRIKDKIGG